MRRNAVTEMFRQGQHGHHQFGRHPGDLRAMRRENRLGGLSRFSPGHRLGRKPKSAK